MYVYYMCVYTYVYKNICIVYVCVYTHTHTSVDVVQWKKNLPSQVQGPRFNPQI